jgi:hypothetical protein
MRSTHGGRLRRVALLLGLCGLAALAVAGATSARVDDDSSGSGFVTLEKPDFVTFCHVAGREEDPANTVTLTLPYNAVFGHAGHFNEDGTPNAGHEQDHLGPCQAPPPPTDVCPNIGGNQADVPEGMVKDEQGNCVTSPPPTDVCPNIGGNQADVPEGMVKDEQGNCVTSPPPTDVCPNIDGNQATVPTGLVKNGQGNCVTPPGTPHQVTGTATVTCDLGAQLYRPSGTIDGQTANSVSPATIPGATKGVVDVTVTRGDTSFRTSVTVNGDCAPPAVTPPAPQTVLVPITVTKPPAAKPTAKPAPASKPVAKPKPAPEMCRVLTIATKLVRANGARHALVAKVTRSRNPVKGVKVRFTGVGISLSAMTNGKGVATVGIKTTKAGIIQVQVTNVKACNTARIGVVGVFQPPVTG